MHRKSRFAGPNSFYPNHKDSLLEFFTENTKPPQKKENAFCVVCPHAGYLYSAKTALKTLEQINIPKKIIIIGPNHTGQGQAVSMMSQGDWEIPGKNILLDSDLAKRITSHSRYIEEDPVAHNYEHSIEVILPILDFFVPDFTFVPIVLGNYSAPILRDLAQAIFQACKEDPYSYLVVASSDMSHFISRQEARLKDEIAFQRILSLDADGLMNAVRDNNISMCGSGPVAVGISYSKMQGAIRAKLIDYTDSGCITGDEQQVVSYAGFVIE